RHRPLDRRRVQHAASPGRALEELQGVARHRLPRPRAGGVDAAVPHARKPRPALRGRPAGAVRRDPGPDETRGPARRRALAAARALRYPTSMHKRARAAAPLSPEALARTLTVLAREVTTRQRARR